MNKIASTSILVGFIALICVALTPESGQFLEHISSNPKIDKITWRSFVLQNDSMRILVSEIDSSYSIRPYSNNAPYDKHRLNLNKIDLVYLMDKYNDIINNDNVDIQIVEFVNAAKFCNGYNVSYYINRIIINDECREGVLSWGHSVKFSSCSREYISSTDQRCSNY